MPKFSDLFFGTPGQMQQQSTLGPEQQQAYGNLQAAANRGSGGAFGQAANYYGNILSDDSEDYNSFAAPEMRRFNQQIIPDLAEQFAGMGSGALSGSGFRNAAVNAGTDLSERLGAIRAGLRQQAAQGLQGIGQSALGQYNENIYRPQSPGLLQAGAQGAGQALGAYATGGFGGLPKAGQSSPYGQSSPGRTPGFRDNNGFSGGLG